MFFESIYTSKDVCVYVAMHLQTVGDIDPKPSQGGGGGPISGHRRGCDPGGERGAAPGGPPLYICLMHCSLILFTRGPPMYI